MSAPQQDAVMTPPPLRGRSLRCMPDSFLAGVELSKVERAWLSLGLEQPGGKLPLFDPKGQAIEVDLIRKCIAKGVAEPWFINPLKPDWLVCRLTELGRSLLTDRNG
jgi:hypothetical protein